MAYSTEEKELYNFGVGAIPKFLFAKPRAEEMMGVFVKIFDAGRQSMDDLFEQTYILDATGAGAAYLDQHAWERVGSRVGAESDAALRERIRNVADALTPAAILAAAQAILDEAGPASPPVAMVELRRDKAYFTDTGTDSGTGGTFMGTAPDMQFEPDAGWARSPYRDHEEERNFKIVVSGAVTGGNDGTFDVTGLVDDAAEYQNGSGAAEYDATVSWTVTMHDRDDNRIDGRQDAYLSRGDRMGHVLGTTKPGVPLTIIFILPYGSTAGTEASVLEMARQKKAASIVALVERRLNP